MWSKASLPQSWDIDRGSVAHSVVVIDGRTLGTIQAEESFHTLFQDLAILADSVICCRASPSQKAALVHAIRRRVSGSVTLAIGDGANDIAMIQEAHVGIGITGKEGSQAARVSDYSIAQFRFLNKLLLVHGRWNYIRTSKYVLATFWKRAAVLSNAGTIPTLERLHWHQSIRAMVAQPIQHTLHFPTRHLPRYLRKGPGTIHSHRSTRAVHKRSAISSFQLQSLPFMDVHGSI